MTTDTGTLDEATAKAALIKTRDDLAAAITRKDDATDALVDTLVRVRPLGILTVDEMAEAIERERNYVDSIWSTYGTGQKGKQTRVPLLAVNDESRAAARTALKDAAAAERAAVNDVKTARAERNLAVARAYGAAIKGFGPSPIAAAADIDRNHVLRLSRKAGLTPAWRKPGTARNQHTTSK